MLVMSFHSQNAFCQINNLNQAVHEKVERYSYADPKGKDWENAKKDLADHTQAELANALMTELDVDRGNRTANSIRDGGVWKLYKALDLPPTLVSKEIEKEQSPKRKARLMTLLRGRNDQGVITELLHQLKDRRPAVEVAENYELPVYTMRVCDVACNILSSNLEPDRSGYRITPSSGYQRRDEIIKETLKDLKLDVTQ